MASNPKTREPRICHVNLAGGYRGGERQTELLVRELSARHWQQRLVARSGGILARRCAGIEGLEISEVLAHPLLAAAAARGCSIVHAHEARATHAGWMLQWTSGVPYLLTRRIDHANSRTFVRTRAYRSANQVVAISTSVARTIEAHYPDIRCQVVPDAHADMLNGHASEERVLGSFNGKTIIGHIGELDHSHKGQGTIIEAAKQLKDSHPDLLFVLVGDGKDEAAFRRAADGLANVQFAGFVDNVGDYLSTFDVFVYPSLREGLGSSLLDAMCFGLPIVAADVGGIPEIVEHEVNGLLIRPENSDGLVAALQRIVEDAGLRERMRRENRVKAAAYGAGRMAASYEAIYRSLLDGAR